jgi:hypothetical protein
MWPSTRQQPNDTDSGSLTDADHRQVRSRCLTEPGPGGVRTTHSESARTASLRLLPLLLLLLLLALGLGEGWAQSTEYGVQRLCRHLSLVLLLLLLFSLLLPLLTTAEIEVPYRTRRRGIM